MGSSPVEGFSHQSARLHGLHEHQNLQVRHVFDLIVLRLEEVFLGDKDALLEQVRVDRYAVLLEDELLTERRGAARARGRRGTRCQLSTKSSSSTGHGKVPRRAVRSR